MQIKNIEINNGFLKNINLSFKPGLNVIIGARGSGKTTLLSMLQHALIESQNQSFNKMISSQLDTGEVIIDYELDDDQRIVVDSEGNGRKQGMEEYILSFRQNEIESLADSPQKRLNLLDLRSNIKRNKTDYFNNHEKISKLTCEIFKGNQLVANSQTLEEKLESFKASLTLLKKEEGELLALNLPHVNEEKTRLTNLEEEVIKYDSKIHQNNEKIANINKNIKITNTLSDEIANLLENVPEALEIDINNYCFHLEKLSSDLTELLNIIISDSENAKAASQNCREKIVPIRHKLESFNTGLGSVTSKIQNANRLINETELELQKLRYEVAKNKKLKNEREELFINLGKIESDIYQRRKTVAEQISANISSNIRINVSRAGNNNDFKAFLKDNLQGLYLRQTFIDKIAEKWLPLNLLEVIEESDLSELIEISEIKEDQAAKVLNALNTEENLVRLSEVTLQDSVDFQLVDKSIIKPIEDLSTGQKCSVSLPIITSDSSKILLLDQPEDHLDNAFLVDNFIVSLRERIDNNAQTIIVSHNANIPVLGEATNIIVLESDGKQGSIRMQGAINDSSIIGMIKKLMEGGEQAFKQRAEFYAKH